MSGRHETAVLKKENSHLDGDGGEDRRVRTREESRRFLKQQIIFPIYEDAREKARQV